MKLTSLKATKVLWVGANGYRRECKVSLGDFDGMQIDLLLSFSDGKLLLRLRSIDGFRFIGKSAVKGQTLVVPATLYRHDNEFVFLGSWHQGTDSGEFVIQAHEVPALIKPKVYDRELTSVV